MRRDAVTERREIDMAVDGRTIPSTFQDTALAHPDRVAIRWRDADGLQSMTWSDYRQAVRTATMGLLSLGFKKGEFGLIMARNRPEHVIADLAIVHAGGTAVSVYNTLPSEQIKYIAEHSEATVVFVEDAGFLKRWQEIRDLLPKVRKIVVMEPLKSPAADLTWAEMMAAGEEADRDDPAAFDRSSKAVKPEDIVALIYTSGTTGPPKGVMYTHRNILWTLESADRVLFAEVGHTSISYLPLSHVSERFSSHWRGLYSAIEVSYCPELALLMPYLLEVRPTAFVGVPRVWEKFYAAISAGIAAEPDEARRNAINGAIAIGHKLAPYLLRGEEPPAELAELAERIAPVQMAVKAKLGLDQCRFAYTSTAPMPIDVMEFFAAIGLPLIEVWGMSELTGPATSNSPGAMKLGTVGPTLPGVEARLDEDGELLIRGGNVMAGYYKDPQLTADTVDGEGWLRTGDVAVVDEDGFYKIVDRKKELIITSSGKNISPSNLESLMKHHPLIGQAIAIGDGRNYLTALVVLDAEVAPGWAHGHGVAASSLAELSIHPEIIADVQRGLADVNRQVSRIEGIKRFTILPVEWTAESDELTPTLKLKRRVIYQRYASEIAGMYREAAPSGHEVDARTPEPVV